MKKIVQGLVCAGLCAVLAVGAAGCGKSAHRDPESDAFKLAIGAVDQKFNPLFYTAQNDGEIANMTQVSMLSVDHSGNLAYGDDYPTVTLDYKETYYDNAGAQIGTGTGDGKVTGESSVEGSTAYEFVLKNGMMYSDGEHPLTVMDVLFNLYVYLDPVYMGSSTIYSTKIKGLQKYRLQDPNAESNSQQSTSKYYSAALRRIEALIDWAEDINPDENALSEQEKADLAEVREDYLEELTTDYNSVETGWEESYKEYKFTEAWQVFYYIEGLVHKQTEQQTDAQGHILGEVDLKDENGKYLTDFDKKGNEEPVAQHLIDDMEAYVTDNFSSYKASHSDLSDEAVTAALQREHAIDYIYDSYSVNAEIDYVLTYCATRSTILDYFMADEMSKDRPEGDLTVPNIEGITVYKTKSFNGNTYTEDHDVLRIEIDGVDPKAKWNFGFTVAPMYYYSDAEHYNAAMAAYENGSVYTEYGANGTVTKAATCKDFGVEYKTITWFNNVLGADEKTALPVGAGAYKATTNSAFKNKSNAGVAGKDFDGGDFFYNYIAYFERNEQFTTMGKNIDNAKIKYVTFEVLSDDKIVTALTTGKIDYGTPVATSDNQKAVRKGNLKQVTYQTGGYGYVGINPQAVPDMEVRQAIMHCFNLSSIVNYYGSKALVSLIHRPMSTTSWAYPESATSYYEQKGDTAADIKFIQDLIASSGNWELNNSGKFVSTEDSSKKLKLTFTIAGESTDHPSYKMFTEAETLLEKCGFDISVETDIQALQKLAAGKLEVWAAAWSSSIDPDPYQIYSINSTASSTKNWYKDGIINDSTGRFWREQAIAEALADRIDEGRQTLSQDARKVIYGGNPDLKANGNYDEEHLKSLSCLNLIMEMAVEFPTYQRNDLCVWDSSVLDEGSMNIKNASLYISPIGEMWKVAFKK